MRRACALFILALVGACGGDTATTTPSTPATSATTAATTLATTTTTVAGPIDLPPSGILLLAPGAEYRAATFWSPLTVVPDRDGWRADGSSELWIYFQYFEPGRSTYDLDLAIITHSPNAALDGVAARITGDPQVSLIAGPDPTILGGHDAVVLDIEVEAAPIGGGGYCGNPTAGNSRFQNNETGMALLEDSNSPIYPHFFGVRSCRGARTWVVDVDGATITIIAATERPEMLDELIPIAEAFVAGIQFSE